MRRTIARRLLESKQTVPHFYLTAEVGLEPLLAMRKQINGSAATRISVNDFVVKAYAMALQRVPDANAVWAEDRILKFQRSDVGVAVAIEGGLFTPVIRNADAKSLSAVSLEIKELAERARERKLKPQEYQGGSAGVSNLGMFGVREFAAIVNPPHATILAVGAGERRPVETEDGGVRFESRMTVTLSVDHRVVDGALGAKLLQAFKAIVENPISALI
jgi:pyruvate dehydrogenase E2 component (dihydrolipoamide acetyltransferase)